MRAPSPRQFDARPPVVNQHPHLGKHLFVSKRVNMRSEPTTSSSILRKIDAGQTVQVLNHRTG
ncbi:SH3 domain-containing protein [Brucella endophytica]|uniref:SH3 domain-containing protein n=1 Tax=Brucella endophytica TaxID=1963359 RepID=UPI003570FAD9